MKQATYLIVASSLFVEFDPGIGLAAGGQPAPVFVNSPIPVNVSGIGDS